MNHTHTDYTYSNQMYLYYMLANSAAPVFVGIKPSCLVTIWKHRIADMNLNQFVQEQNARKKFDCQLKILLETELYYLLFCYHKELLQETLCQSKGNILMSGYASTEKLEDALGILMDKLKRYHTEHQIFPHEVGIFLGYPLWDVEGFIQNHGQNYKLIGYWKVYDDVIGAIRKFQEYDRRKRQAVGIFQQYTERNNHKK